MQSTTISSSEFILILLDLGTLDNTCRGRVRVQQFTEKVCEHLSISFRLLLLLSFLVCFTGRRFILSVFVLLKDFPVVGVLFGIRICLL